MKRQLLNKESNEIQRVIALRNSRNKRYRYQEFIIEGTIAIDQALKSAWPIKSVFYNREHRLSAWAQGTLRALTASSIYAISQNLMLKISERADCPELLLIGQTHIQSFSSYLPTQPEVVLVLDQPKSAGNLGTIIRSAAAFGVKTIVLSGHAADEYDPQCLRSSVGGFFNIAIYRTAGIEKFTDQIERLRATQPVDIIATGNKGDSSLPETTFSQNLLFIVFGNETHGVSEGFRKLAQQFLSIPLQGELTSLNIGAAASIFLYEIFRQRL